MPKESSCDRVFVALHEAIDREAKRARRDGIDAGPFFLGALHALVRQSAHLAAGMVTPADHPKEEVPVREKRLHDVICEAFNQAIRAEWKDATGSETRSWLPEHGGHA